MIARLSQRESEFAKELSHEIAAHIEARINAACIGWSANEVYTAMQNTYLNLVVGCCWAMKQTFPEQTVSSSAAGFCQLLMMNAKNADALPPTDSIN